MTAKILLVEDDELASATLHQFLAACDFEVQAVYTATDSVSHAVNERFDVVILDINLPDFSGFEVLKSLRKTSSVPVIVTSAYSDTASKLKAFQYGADDYMVKPLDLEELEARIWLQLRRNSQIDLPLPRQTFEKRDGSIYHLGRRLDLTTIEYEILSYLIANRKRVVEREELASAVALPGSTRSLDNHIKNIRKKIGDSGHKATYLKTVYGVGYMLEA